MSEELLGAKNGIFNLATVKEQISNWSNSIGLPTMKKPLGLGQEYEMPTKVEDLSMIKLGDLQLQIGAWYTYALSVLADEEFALSSLESMFNLKADLGIQEVMDDYAANKLKAPVKEAARAIAISRDKTLNEIYKNIVVRKARITKLKAQAKIYEEHLNRLSREQSRRDLEKV